MIHSHAYHDYLLLLDLEPLEHPLGVHFGDTDKLGANVARLFFNDNATV